MNKEINQPLFPEADSETSEIQLLRRSPFHPTRQNQNSENFLLWASINVDLALKKVTSVSSGIEEYEPFVRRLEEINKIERQRQNSLAGAMLDESAKKILDVLDKSTSIKWEDLAAKSDLSWHDIARGVAFLSSANLCEPEFARLRLTESGERLLALSV